MAQNDMKASVVLLIKQKVVFANQCFVIVLQMLQLERVVPSFCKTSYKNTDC